MSRAAVVIDRDTGLSKGTAFITFDEADAAAAAVARVARGLVKPTFKLLKGTKRCSPLIVTRQKSLAKKDVTS